MPPENAPFWSIKKYQEVTKIVYHEGMTKPLNLQLDRSAKTPLTEQIRKGITAAIESGVLAPRARAAQTGRTHTCTRPQAARQILLATRASSTHDL